MQVRVAVLFGLLARAIRRHSACRRQLKLNQMFLYTCESGTSIKHKILADFYLFLESKIDFITSGFCYFIYLPLIHLNIVFCCVAFLRSFSKFPYL